MTSQQLQPSQRVQLTKSDPMASLTSQPSQRMQLTKSDPIASQPLQRSPFSKIETLTQQTAPSSQAQKMQLIKSERHLFSSSDDSAVMKQILATHTPDGRDVDVRPLLMIVEDILHQATPTVVVDPETHFEMVDDKTHQAGISGMLEALAFTIHKIACEISCKCSGGGDAHATTLAVFHTLASYSWDAKVVLALSAFAVSYGEFWLTAQLHTVNPLAKSVALLKQLPDILEHTESLKPRFEALNALVKAMLDVTKSIIQLTMLPSEYITPDTPSLSMAITHIPTAVYWTIRSVIACASQIISLIGVGHEYVTSTTEAWELSSLAHKVRNIHDHLTKQLNLCYQHIEETRHIESYHLLVRLFETIHIENMKILKALIYSKDDLPLVDGLTKKRVSVDVLRRKIVILFISDLDVSHEELMVLAQIYNDTQHAKLERHYEMVWLPVIDKTVLWNESREDMFIRLANTMPWYSLQHPSLLEPAAIRYIKEVWHFQKKPMLVVLDAQGKVVCPNAFHMMWIWGSLAFPFTSLREETLWREETWRLEFLVDEIDPTILQWVREGRYICLYGGEDIDWIRRFTSLMRRAALESRIPLEMIYVGKSNPKERIRKITGIINDEKLSGTWHDLVMIWYFWVRLESMWYSKMHHNRTIENDAVMQEVMTLLSFDGSDQGWAVISHGSTEMVRANGKILVECLSQFDSWKANIEIEGFINALINALSPLHTHEHCTRLILPGTTGVIQENVVCAECKRPMEKFILYRCCND